MKTSLFLYRKISILLIASCLFTTNMEAQKIEHGGFCDSYLAVRKNHPHDILSWRTRFRGELEGNHKQSRFFVSFNLNQNNMISSQNGFELRETFFEYTDDKWDLKIGRQIVNWGHADGLRITDLISPYDLTEFLARDYDDIKIPVEAFRVRLLRHSYRAELIYVPIFKKFILPDPGSPWEFKSLLEGTILTNDNIQPKMRNGEIGGKIQFFTSGFDFDITALSAINKLPVFNIIGQDSLGYLFNPEHHRYYLVGYGFEIPKSKFVFRGEMAYNYGKKHTAYEKETGVLFNKNTFNVFIGIDGFFRNSLTLMIQLANEYILDYEEKLDAYKHTCLATVSLSKKILRDNVTLSTYAYIGLNNYDIFDRSSIEASLTDRISLSIGYDFFYGDKGMYAQFKNNSEIWVKAKYNL